MSCSWDSNVRFIRFGLEGDGIDYLMGESISKCSLGDKNLSEKWNSLGKGNKNYAKPLTDHCFMQTLITSPEITQW